MPDSREAAEQQIEDAAESVLQAWLAVALADAVTPTAINPTVVLSFVDEWTDLVEDRLLPPIRETWTDRFESIAGRPPASAFIDDYMRQVSNRMRGVPDDVAARIHQIVARNADTSIPEIAALIHGELEYTGTQNWPHRATVIARTETSGAWNGAALAAHSQDPDAATLTKTWLATNDDRTRFSHRRADGQTARLGDAFTVGGFPLRFPGDPLGPASEIINCRCALTFAEAAQQMPIAAAANSLAFANRLTLHE